MLGKNNPIIKLANGKSVVRFSVVPDDPKLARMQEDERAADDHENQGTPFREGMLLEIDFNDNLMQTVPHKLGGPVSGFILCDIVPKTSGGAITIFREDETSTDKIDFSRAQTHVKFRATSGCKTKLWVWR